MKDIAEELILTMYKNHCDSLLAFLIMAKDEIEAQEENDNDVQQSILSTSSTDISPNKTK